MQRHVLLAGVLSLAVTSLAATSLGCNSGSVKNDDTGTSGTGGDGGDGGGDGGADGGMTDGGTGDGGTWTSDCPSLAVSETAVSFGAISWGSSAGATVVVTNACTGEGDLDVEASISGDDAFIGSLPTTTLAPGAAATIDITFAPADYGDFSGTMLVTSSDPDAPSVELPLLGGVVADADGDGYDAVAAGGDDCDDDNADIFPADSESAQDLVDDNCDGTVDEDWIDAGDVYITEVMMNPVAVGDAYGEWFELKNAAGATIDLIGWRFLADDGDELVITDSVLVDDGGVIVFGLTSDTSLNGGVTVDVVYSREDLSLADTADSIFVYMGSEPMSELSYTGEWPIRSGASLSLDPQFGLGDNLTTPDVWCSASSTYGVGDKGTPGATNDWCSSVDHDLDGFSEDEGDCDDEDAEIFPGQVEAWDGIDNNCDGYIDVVSPDDALAQIVGNSGDYLGGEDGLSIGDLDGDGTPDLIVGGHSLASASQGVTAVIDGSGWEDWDGAWDGLYYASVTGTGNYNYLSWTGSSQGDQNGDGVDDLVVVGSDVYSGYSYGYPIAAVLMFGGDDFSGDYAARDDYDVFFTDTTGGYSSGIRVDSSLDVNGDGYSDVVYGNSAATINRNTYTGVISIMSGADFEEGGDYSFEDDYSLRAWGEDSYSYFGDSLGGGDLDGDGYDELFIGAPGYYYDSTTIGHVYVIEGGTSTLGGSGSIGLIAGTRFEGAAAGDRLGADAPATLGDFDGDDSVDLVLAAPDIGTVYVFSDAASLGGEVVVTEADAVIEGEGPDYFGRSLYAGDFNGDDYDELVVGAPDTDTYSYISYYADEPGAAYIFEGSDLTGELGSDDASYSVVSNAVDGLGFNVNGADFDGDGTDELIVNAPGSSSGVGRVWVFNP